MFNVDRLVNGSFSFHKDTPEFVVVYRCSFCNEITRDFSDMCFFDERSDSWVVVCADCDGLPDTLGASILHVDDSPVGFLLKYGLEYEDAKRWLTQSIYENAPSEIFQKFYEAFVFPSEFASKFEV